MSEGKIDSNRKELLVFMILLSGFQNFIATKTKCNTVLKYSLKLQLEGYNEGNGIL